MQPDGRNPALRIALIYALAAACWILLSDVILTSLITGGPPAARSFALPSILKGLLFVAVTAAMLYLLVRDAVANVWRAKARMQLLFDGVNDAVYPKLLSERRTGPAAGRQHGAQRIRLPRAELLQMTRSTREAHPAEDLENYTPTAPGRLRDRRSQRRRRDPVEVSIHVNDIEGVPTAASARDIRDRKRAEAERREAAPPRSDKRAFYRRPSDVGGRFQLVEPEEARTHPRPHASFCSRRGKRREVHVSAYRARRA